MGKTDDIICTIANTGTKSWYLQCFWVKGNYDTTLGSNNNTKIETLVQVTIPLSLLTYIGTKIFLFLFFLLFSQHIYCVTSSSIATTTTFLMIIALKYHLINNFSSIYIYHH